MTEKTTHFGFQDVAWAEKQKKVAGVFHSVAQKYDVMNDLMSLGVHRVWKRFTIELSGVQRGQRVLDIAGGTGDLAILARCDVCIMMAGWENSEGARQERKFARAHGIEIIYDQGA